MIVHNELANNTLPQNGSLEYVCDTLVEVTDVIYTA
jgi:hypothetical protein